MKTINNFLQENISFKVYCDLDGVLSDFDTAISEIGFGQHRGQTSIDDKDMWKNVIKKGISFWSEMQWMSDGEELWKFIKRSDPIILSASLSGNQDSINGKKIWIRKHLGMDVKSIICLRKEKQKYANSDSILIDDKEKNINEWKEKDGIGILHKNSKLTIRKLKDILNI